MSGLHVTSHSHTLAARRPIIMVQPLYIPSLILLSRLLFAQVPL